MEGDSKRNGMVQAPAIISDTRKIHIPPRAIRILMVKTTEESMGFAFIFNLHQYFSER
jgi:hypothetical protein